MNKTQNASRAFVSSLADDSSTSTETPSAPVVGGVFAFFERNKRKIGISVSAAAPTPVREFSDLAYLQRVVIHLYDILDDISTADDMAKSDDVAYRRIVGRLQQQKNDSGVSSPDGYGLTIESREFQTKDEQRATA